MTFYRSYYSIFSTASRLTSWDNSNKQNIWQLSGQTQGDMILTPEQRNGLVNTWYRWGNREVPYELDPIFGKFTFW